MTEPKAVAWRYQRKEDWGDIWRVVTILPTDFEDPDDWTVQPLGVLADAQEARSGLIEKLADWFNSIPGEDLGEKHWNDLVGIVQAHSPISEGQRQSDAPAERQRWPRKGDLMAFLGENGYPFELEEAKKIFTVGGLYRVHDCNVQSFSHSIQFVGVKGRFNGVMFRLDPSSVASTDRK